MHSIKFSQGIADTDARVYSNGAQGYEKLQSAMPENTSTTLTTNQDESVHTHGGASSLASPEDAAERTLQCGLHACRVIREEIYLTGHKSTNKQRLDVERHITNDRLLQAAKAILSTREFEIGSDAYIRSAREAKGHNCDELAVLVYDWVSGNSTEEVNVISLNGMHKVAILGTMPDDLPDDMEKWPPHVTVVDPWANVVCPAKEYPKCFAAKMEKWEASRKLIQSKGEWISPLDPAWLAMFKRSDSA
jgi:hypothetical protein